jgi:hypothetical protein
VPSRCKRHILQHVYKGSWKYFIIRQISKNKYEHSELCQDTLRSENSNNSNWAYTIVANGSTTEQQTCMRLNTFSGGHAVSPCADGYVWDTGNDYVDSSAAYEVGDFINLQKFGKCSYLFCILSVGSRLRSRLAQGGRTVVDVHWCVHRCVRVRLDSE